MPAEIFYSFINETIVPAIMKLAFVLLAIKETIVICVKLDIFYLLPIMVKIFVNQVIILKVHFL